VARDTARDQRAVSETEPDILDAHYIVTFDNGTSVAVFKNGLIAISVGGSTRTMFAQDWYNLVFSGRRIGSL